LRHVPTKKDEEGKRRCRGVVRDGSVCDDHGVNLASHTVHVM